MWVSVWDRAGSVLACFGLGWAPPLPFLVGKCKHTHTHKAGPRFAAAFNANVTNVLRLAAYALTLGKHL